VSRWSLAASCVLLISSTHDAAQALLRTATERTPAARGRAAATCATSGAVVQRQAQQLCATPASDAAAHVAAAVCGGVLLAAQIAAISDPAQRRMAQRTARWAALALRLLAKALTTAPWRHAAREASDAALAQRATATARAQRAALRARRAAPGVTGAAGAAFAAGVAAAAQALERSAAAGAQRREGTGMTRSSMPVLMGALAGLARGSGLAVQRVVAPWSGDSAWERSRRATAVARLAEATWEAQRLALRLRCFVAGDAAQATATAIAAGAALGGALQAAQIAAGPRPCWTSAWAALALTRLGRALDTAWRPGASADASLVRDLDIARRAARRAADAARRVHPAAVAAAAAALDGAVRQAAHAWHALALEDARSPAS